MPKVTDLLNRVSMGFVFMQIKKKSYILLHMQPGIACGITDKLGEKLTEQYEFQIFVLRESFRNH